MCLKLKTELLNKKDFVEKEIYDKLFKSFTTLEKHCISLEVDTQLNQEIFQRDNSVSNQSAPSFDQLFELNELKAQSQEKDTVIKKLKERIKSLSGKMNEDKIKKDLEEIETINIELDHRVSKLIAENEHLKQTYKQLYDSIKPARIRSKEQSLKDDLRKLKGKALVHNDVTKHPSDPEMLKIDVEPITPKLLNKKTAHSAYIKHTQEEATVLRDLVEHVKSKYPLDHSLESALKPSTSASGSQPSDKTKKDKIRQTPSSTQKNKVEAHHRKVKSSLKNKDCVVQPKGTAHVQHSKLNANSELKCVKCNSCMLSDNHNLCVLDFINNVNARKQSKSVKKSSKRKVWKPTRKVFTNIGYIWRPTGRTFTIVGNVCPLTRITTTTEVTHRKPTALENETPKPVLKSVSANKKEPSQSWVSIVSEVPSSSLDDFKFGNDHIEKIMGYSDYQIGNVTISRVYYVEGLGHNLFSVGQFSDSNLKVAFRQHTCFIRNLEGVDLLTGSRGNNLYTLSLGDIMASSPICLLSKASKTKSWLWHRRLSHLNFGNINHLAIHGLVRGLLKLKFEKDHLCSACARGKSKKKPYKPKSKDTNQEICCTWIFVDQCMSQALMEEKAVATACYTQNRSIIRLRYGKTPYELLHDKPLDLSFSMYLAHSAIRQMIVRTWLTTMASEHSSSEPALHEMTPATISSGLMPNPPPLTLFVPPLRKYKDILFQLMFDELLTPLPSFDYPAIEVCALIHEVVALVPAVSTGSPSSTNVDQDAPSPSHSQTTPKTQALVTPNDVKEDNHDFEIAHMGNDPYFSIPIPEIPSNQSSSLDSIDTIMHLDH
ncbi:retrovirus-related pol polyprotein from transposon TNT 1-94 [Tanacetum coccineum]